MTKKLSYKIFAAFLLIYFLVLVLMVGSIRFFAHQNFSDYVHRVEIEMLDVFIDMLSAEYQKYSNWQSLRGNIMRWYRVLNVGRAKTEAQQQADQPNPDPSQRRYISRILSRLTLFDQHKSLIAGRSRSIEGHVLREIKAEGKTVGWLGLKKHERLSHPLDVDFLKEQSRVFYLVGIGVLIFGAFVSFFLARHLLAPIKKLTAGTQALTSLNFQTRIDVDSTDEMGQLAADFNVMAKTLEESEQMRQQWITDISHELRTPLSILRGEIEAIQDGIRQANRDTLESLHSEAIYLTKIVGDLHDLSLAETGALPFNKEQVNPVQVLRETKNLFENRFARHQITVSDELGDPLIALKGDSDRLMQLFSNLFENALRYADSPGALRIWQKREKDWIMLFLEDSGPGVPEASVDRLFDRLYRVDPARTRARGGSGLGLSICKKIVEAHGGRIKAENITSGGLRFQIALPLFST